MDSWFACKNVYFNISILNTSKIENKTSIANIDFYTDHILVSLNCIYIRFYNLCHDVPTHKENIIQIIKGNMWADSEDVAFKQRSKVASNSCPIPQNY